MCIHISSPIHPTHSSNPHITSPNPVLHTHLSLLTFTRHLVEYNSDKGELRAHRGWGPGGRGHTSRCGQTDAVSHDQDHGRPCVLQCLYSQSVGHALHAVSIDTQDLVIHSTYTYTHTLYHTLVRTCTYVFKIFGLNTFIRTYVCMHVRRCS